MQEKQSFNPTQKPIGIVLSGGGGRALVHLGIWKALEEKGIQPQKISGVSMGGIIGAMWAAGYSADETTKIFQSESWKKWFRPTWSENGIISIQKLKTLFASYLPKTFEELKTPLTVSSFCLQTAKIERFETGDLISPLLASMAVPAIFSPIRIKEYDFVDSGLLENLPTKVFYNSENKKSDYFIIGMHSNPLPENFIPTSTRSVIERYFQAVGVFLIKKDIPNCDIYIEPKEIATIKFSNIDINKAFQIGYDSTKIFLNKFEI
ncbi:putative esterase of the alpha-beta hydrolase superfamily [Bernardetia litoralis DSM 6794]|uniref:Putative esterase of the alpha-beta hydrolase superfamily n=1 Tax=Bernardetia litoralis (strain ATCC 23117 / DSM 6794 / NBRC 15988 / NCIMB 1366 / Fx l1 / Sio-4) TaxID=880071 RepID=I4AQ58_BERLS|nr:patatin-like phospholipase family protein [Bernardetia litoralis]AFM06093.1 putative esterase of the alpha-beta hydrolase superfamily [Bernardetia litoralis DSM 6794]